MFELEYDPGHIQGHIVLKKASPFYNEHTEFIGFEWEEEDIGSHMGPRRIQVPMYKKEYEYIGHKITWQVLTSTEYEKFAKRFN